MTRGTIEVAHEALIRGWPRLRAWIDEDREGQRLHRRITADSDEWQRSQDAGLLYRKLRLAQALAWLKDHADAVNALERSFLDAAELQRDRENEAELQTRRELQEAQQRELDQAQRAAEAAAQASRRIRRRSWGLAALAFAALALAAVSFQQRSAAEQQRERANTVALVSLSRQLAAQAQDPRSTQYDLALLLGLHAVRTHQSKESLSGLAQAIDAASRVDRYLSDHSAWVNAVVVSPDGKWVASAGDDQTVLLWDVASGKVRHRLDAKTTSVAALAFAPDSSWLVSVGHKGSARLWQTASGALSSSLNGANDDLYAVAVSPDGQHIVAAGTEGRLMLWNASDGAALPSPGMHPEGVLALGFVGKDSFASGGSDGRLGLWTLGVGQPVRWLGKHGAEVRALAVHAASGAWVSAGADGSLLRWDRLGRGQALSMEKPLSGLRSVALSADGQWIAAAGDAHEVVVLNASDGQIFAHLRGHQAAVLGLAFAPGGGLYSASKDRTVIAWKPVSRWHRFDHEITPLAMNASALSADGAMLALAGKDGRVLRTRLDQEAPVGEDRVHDKEVNSVAFSADGRWLASGGADKKVVLRPASPGTDKATVLDDHGAIVWGLAFDDKGRWLASASNGGFVMLRDLNAPTQPARRLQGHDSWAYGVAFSPGGRWLASSGGDGNVMVWDPNSGALLRTLKGHTKASNGIVFSPDGQWLASAGDDQQVLLWRTSDWARTAHLRGHAAEVWAVVFSPDSRTLASAGWDRTVALWDVATGTMRAQMWSDERQLNSVAFTPDGKRLVASGSGTSVHLFNVDAASWPALACRVANRNLTVVEWQRYLGTDQDYVKACPDLPVPGS